MKESSSHIMKSLAQVQQQYAGALKLPIVICDASGNLVVGNPSQNAYLSHIATTGLRLHTTWQKTLENCIERAKIMGRAVTCKMEDNVYTVCVPFRIGSTEPLMLLAGPIRLKNPNVMECEARAKELKLPLEQYLEAFLSLALWREEQIDAAGKLLQTVMEEFVDEMQKL